MKDVNKLCLRMKEAVRPKAQSGCRIDPEIGNQHRRNARASFRSMPKANKNVLAGRRYKLVIGIFHLIGGITGLPTGLSMTLPQLGSCLTAGRALSCFLNPS
jgi:hypothetical protein